MQYYYEYYMIMALGCGRRPQQSSNSNTDTRLGTICDAANRHDYLLAIEWETFSNDFGKLMMNNCHFCYACLDIDLLELRDLIRLIARLLERITYVTWHHRPEWYLLIVRPVPSHYAHIKQPELSCCCSSFCRNEKIVHQSNTWNHTLEIRPQYDGTHGTKQNRTD